MDRNWWSGGGERGRDVPWNVSTDSTLARWCATVSILLLALLAASPAAAQVSFGGSVDAAVTAGGAESRFYVNGVAQEYRTPHLSIRQLNVFLFAEPGGDFLVDGRVQFDTWGSGELNPPRLTLAALRWVPEDRPVEVSVGRFVSPFGLYPKRQLALDRTFTEPPLLYDYFVNVSDRRGLWLEAGSSGTYGESDVGLSTIYFGGYATGARVNWTAVPNRLDVAAAVTNSAPASPTDYTNTGNAAALARVAWQPAIFWTQGVSAAYGSFMQEAPVNSSFENLNYFRQLLLGTDWTLAYSYFELTGELVYARWRVPRSTRGIFETTDGGALLRTYDLNQLGGYADLRYEPPFLTGSYVALRAEHLAFGSFADPATGETRPWDDDVTRLSVAAGYKLARSVLLKASFADQFQGGMSSYDAYAARAVLTVAF